MRVLVLNQTSEDRTHLLEVEPDATVEDLKCLLEVESGLAVADQAIFFGNNKLKEDAKKLTDYGIGNDEMLTMKKATTGVASQHPRVEAVKGQPLLTLRRPLRRPL